nr:MULTISPECIES: LysR family transcriptional regulator [unclassified Halomonas]
MVVKASLQAIRVFEVAARLESFKEAAEELSMTPAGVSHHISNLEQRLGVPLFTRKNRKVTLTVGGRQLSEATTDGLQRIQRALDDIKLDASRINVEATSSFAALVLIPLLRDFNQVYQNIDVEVSTGEAVSAKMNALPIRLGDVNMVGKSSVLKVERFNVYGAPSYLRTMSANKTSFIYLTKWKNSKLPDSPWTDWLTENEGAIPNVGIRYFDQELYGVYEAMAGKGLVFCSETLVSEFVKANTLQPVSKQNIESQLCYYIPTQSGQYSAKKQIFIKWLNANII